MVINKKRKRTQIKNKIKTRHFDEFLFKTALVDFLGLRLRGNRNDFGMRCFRNLLVVEPNNFVVSPNTTNQYRYHDRVSAPRYTINKSKCKNSNKHIRFYRFVNCVFSYSPCISCWLSPTKTVVF